jgi:hypothetical protein
MSGVGFGFIFPFSLYPFHFYCTPAQIVALEEWKAVGVRVFVVYSKEDVRKIMIGDGFDLMDKCGNNK